MTTSTTLHQQKQAPGFGGNLQRQAQAANGSQRARLYSLGRPFPGACHQRSLLSAIDELTDAVRLLTSALVGEAPGGKPRSGSLIPWKRRDSPLPMASWAAPCYSSRSPRLRALPHPWRVS
jgi:hypothetical protein